MHTHTLPYPISQVHKMAEMLTADMVQKQVDEVMAKKIAENPELAALLEVQHEQFYPEMSPDWNNDVRAKEKLLSWGRWSFADPFFHAFLYQLAGQDQLVGPASEDAELPGPWSSHGACGFFWRRWQIGAASRRCRSQFSWRSS